MELPVLTKSSDVLRGELPRDWHENRLAVDFCKFTDDCRVKQSYSYLVGSLTNSLLWISKEVFLLDRNGDRMLNATPDFTRRSSSSPQLSLTFRNATDGVTSTIVIWLKNTANNEGSTQIFEERSNSSEMAVLEATSLLLNLLHVWECHSVRVHSHRTDRALQVSDDVFTTLVKSSHLRELEFINVHLLGSQCLALGNLFSDKVKLTVWDVTMSDSTAFSVGLSQHLGPTKLEVWTMLGGFGLNLLEDCGENTRVKELVCGGAAGLQSDNINMITACLTRNKGLERLCLSCSLSEKAWVTLWKAIETHPALKCVDIRNSSAHLETACLREHTQPIIKCLEVNKTLQSIEIPSRNRDDNLWRQVVRPSLQNNIYRPRFESLCKVDNRYHCEALIAKALLAVRKTPSLIYLALQVGSIHV